MLDPSRHPLPAAPVAEIERRIRWRALPALAFLVILVALGVVAVMPMLRPPRIVTGLPADPDARAAAELLRDRLRFDAAGLRYRLAVIGDNRQPPPAAPAVEPEVDRAAALLASARRRHPDDARLEAAAASLDLARHDLARAERGYREVLDRASHYGEARLGLGLALALEAAAATGDLEARRFRLEAIAQFAAVDPRDPAFEAALYDRALLLGRVGRRDEARALARDYLAGDGGSRWAAALRGELGIAGL
jgi:tetratricopeptide (TPR) repeat protein